jgi:hypothetical protein
VVEGVGDVAADLIDRLPEIGQQVAEGIGSAFGAVCNGRHCRGSIGRGAAIGSMLGPLGALAGGAVGGLIAQEDCMDAVEYAFDAAGNAYEATQIVFSDVYCPDGSIAVVTQQVGPGGTGRPCWRMKAPVPNAPSRPSHVTCAAQFLCGAPSCRNASTTVQLRPTAVQLKSRWIIAAAAAPSVATATTALQPAKPLIQLGRHTTHPPQAVQALMSRPARTHQVLQCVPLGNGPMCQSRQLPIQLKAQTCPLT